jgi:hypothetical protein
MKARMGATARATSARFDRRRSRIVVSLDNGLELAFPPNMAEGLAGAKPADLAIIEISPTGLGVHWPRLDADLYLPALMNGVFGSRRWMAGLLGAAGGKSTSPAKRSAAQANGRLGGRPRKAVAA